MLPLESGDCYYMRGTAVTPLKCTQKIHMLTQCSHGFDSMSEYGGGCTYITPCFSVSCTLSQMTRTSRMHFTFPFMLSPHLLIVGIGWMGLRLVCEWEGEKRELTWPQHRALRFHEIVCIREVRKTKCYFLKSCDPLPTTSLWGEQTANHGGVNHSLMLLAAADTSTLLFSVPWVFPGVLIFS